VTMRVGRPLKVSKLEDASKRNEQERAVCQNKINTPHKGMI
jgi:hypothetical protein